MEGKFRVLVITMTTSRWGRWVENLEVLADPWATEAACLCAIDGVVVCEDVKL